MGSYTIGEWEVTTLKETLHPVDQAVLLQLRLNNRVEIDELKDGLRIKAKSWVGVIQFHNFQVQIVPKLAGENLGLVNMLTYAAGVNALKRFNSQRYLDIHHQGNLLDLIAWLFCDACEVILAGGLLFDYERQEDTLSNLRGRLLIDKQIRRRFGQIDRLECRFDEHSSNILENQLLSFGLLKAGRLVQDEVIRNRVKRLFSIFSETCQLDQLDLQATRNEIFYNRLNIHYQEAHQLAWMIIDGLGIEDLFKSNQTPSFVFLLDMNQLFEQFLNKYLTDLLKINNLSVTYQHHDRSIIWDFFRNRSYSQVIPDFLVSSRFSTKKLAVDAKYKLYDDRKIDPGDIAQIFLYAYAYDHSLQPTALLIYPTEEKSEHRATMMIRQTNQPNGAKIHILGLHIPKALEEIRSREVGDTSKTILNRVRDVFSEGSSL